MCPVTTDITKKKWWYLVFWYFYQLTLFLVAEKTSSFSNESMTRKEVTYNNQSPNPSFLPFNGCIYNKAGVESL